MIHLQRGYELVALDEHVATFEHPHDHKTLGLPLNEWTLLEKPTTLWIALKSEPGPWQMEGGQIELEPSPETYTEPADVNLDDEIARHAEKQGISWADAWRHFERQGYDMTQASGQYEAGV